MDKKGFITMQIDNYTTEQENEIIIPCNAIIDGFYVYYKNQFSTQQEIEVYSVYGISHRATELFDTCNKRYTIRPAGLSYVRQPSHLANSSSSQKMYVRLGNSLAENNTAYITITYTII